ncbi:MAG: ABC transporter ATP-binding protein [Trueperaceae bacterium]|nr:ABC transporter ATP-binding protein [Trueperaceae bacterium]
MSESLVRASQLVKRYHLGSEIIHALNGVSLEIRQGEFVAVMGPSGSGKSTLLHLLGLLDVPDEGSISLEGKSTASLSDDALTHMRRDKLGFIFQTFELIPTLTAKENMMLPAEVAGKRAEAEKRCQELAALLNISDRLNHKPNELSGGQRQRVAIGRALINDPVLILADEPTGNLDSKTGEEVLELLRQGVLEQGWTVVMVTHDVNAATYADRIIQLKDGQIEKESRAVEVQAAS